MVSITSHPSLPKNVAAFFLNKWALLNPTESTPLKMGDL